MAPKRRTDWLSPLKIPEGKVGECEIRKFTTPAGQGVPLNSHRNRIFGAQGGDNTVTWPYDTIWTELVQEGARWMTDLPVEQRQHDELLIGVRGNVLVGGLGLGYAATYLCARKSVKSVTVVEISPEVVELVARHVADPDRKLRVVTADLFDYLKTYEGKPFTNAFYDIWRSDGEYTFFYTVVPLHDLSKTKVTNRPICWQEDVMRGQLRWSIQSRMLFLANQDFAPRGTPDPSVPLDEKDAYAIWHNWSVPFFQWHKERQPNEQLTQKGIQIYSSIYGLAHWEHLWKQYVQTEL